MTARRRVRCPACRWAGQRAADALDRPCPDCGAAVQLGGTRPGRVPSPQRRVEVRPYVLPETLEALGSEPSRAAASVLDAWARRRS